MAKQLAGFTAGFDLVNIESCDDVRWESCYLAFEVSILPVGYQMHFAARTGYINTF